MIQDPRASRFVEEFRRPQWGLCNFAIWMMVDPDTKNFIAGSNDEIRQAMRTETLIVSYSASNEKTPSGDAG